MKKKIALIICMLLCFCFVLSGCTLFERNLAKYYNTTVVSIEYENGDRININKKELIIAFNNYGAQLVQNGASYSDALDKTITALINQKVLIKDSKDKITFTNLERNNLWKDTYDSIFTNMDDFVEEIKKEWEITIAEEIEKKEEESTAYKPYEPKAKVVFENGHYVIKVVESAKDDDNQALICNSEDINEIVNSIYTAVMEKTVLEDGMDDQEKLKVRINAEAIKRYTKLLLANEEGQKLSTDKAEVFKREIKRIYQNSLDSKTISKMQDYISYTTTLSKITVDDVLNKYKSMILSDMTKYSIDDSKLSDDMTSSYSSVNYVPNDDYFFVTHVLLQFSNEQKTEYSNLKSQKEKGEISETYYNQQLDALVKQIVAVEKDADGKVVEDSHKTSEQVLSEIQSVLASATTDAQKDQAFKEMIYKYNQDPGALNSEYLYVIGKNASKMVESFTEASRKLDEDGIYGAISGFVPSEHGVHIIYYAGKVKNAFNFANADDVKFVEEDIKTLSQTLLNPMHNKTLFDKVYESISISESSVNQASYINILKQNLKITKYKNAYKDLLD